jgi:DNA-binding MarR family transcriptional regulator
VEELVTKNTTLTLEAFLPDRLAILSGRISDVLEELCRARKLSVNELFALIALGQFGAMTARALGTKCHMHKTKVSRLVANLSRQGLIRVQTNPVDRRQTLIDLTPLGRVLRGEYAIRAAEFSRELTDAISVEDRDVFEKCLRKLAQRAKELRSTTPSSLTSSGRAAGYKLPVPGISE